MKPPNIPAFGSAQLPTTTADRAGQIILMVTRDWSADRDDEVCLEHDWQVERSDGVSGTRDLKVSYLWRHERDGILQIPYLRLGFRV